MPSPTLGGARAYALSPIQEGLLFHSLYAPGAGHYAVQMRVRLGRLDRAAFKHAWQRVVDRHDILRTAFVGEPDGAPLQVVQPALGLQWSEHDCRAQSEPERWLEEFVARDRVRDFDFSQAPLMRLALIGVAEGADEFIWTFHHAILDGWSVPLVLAEVVGFYRARVEGRELSLPAPRPFRDYIAWLERQDATAAETFWRGALHGLTGPATLGSTRVPEAGEIETRGIEEYGFSIDLTDRVRAFARRHELTINTVVQGVWAILLGRYSGESQVVFGAPVAGRPADLPGAESMVGLFINTLPIVARIRDDMRIVDWLKQFQALQVEARRFEYTPQAKLHEWSGFPQDVPLFESFLAFENYPILDTLKQRSAAGPDIVDLSVSEQAHYPLILTVVPDRAARLRLNYDRRRFEASTVASALGHFEALLTATISAPDARIGALEMFTPAETARLREQAQGATAEYPSQCLHELIEAQVDRTPDALAVVHGADEVTYAELDRRANQLAWHLMARGVSPASIVGICLPHSIDVIVALLATLKTGATYLPVDPDAVRLRIATMIGDAAPALVITSEGLAAIFEAGAGACQILALEREQPSIARASTERPRVATGAAQLAYVMYTSGSTGTPKGVMVSHRSLVNYIWFARHTYDAGDALTTAFYSPLSFDLTVTSIYVPLVSGGRIDITDARREGSFPIHDIVAADRVHLLKATPSHLALLKERRVENRRLRRIVVGGEALPTALAAETQNSLDGHPAIINEYGPTEATVGCTIHVFDAMRDTGPFVPIGRPLSNLQTYVLDRGGRLCPPGVIGEIVIGGDGVADGYWQRAAQTAERFTPDPFSPRPGARLYRSGDFGYWLRDGVLAYVGRRDDQVKYHGHRVELNEIRVALNAHPSIRDCVVVVRRDADDVRLIAYYVADDDIEPKWLREHLSTRIVRETMPNAFVRIAFIPLTRNGKVDDAALADAGGGVLASARTYVAPETALERDLCEIFEAVLRRERVGLEDDYFDLGGDSIKSIQIASRARQRGIEVMVRDLFAHPAVGALARELERRSVEQSARDAAMPGGAVAGAAGASGFTSEGREGREWQAVIARYPDAEDAYPLSPTQEGILFHTLQAPGSGVYLTQIPLRLSGVEPEVLEQAWAQVIARHQILRTAMMYEGVDTPVQVVRRAIDITWVREDWRHLDEAGQQARLQEYVRGVADRGFPLDQAPIMTLGLMDVDGGDHLFVWSYHHILLDGWSVALVLSEVSECYAAIRAGVEQRLEAPRPYRNHVAWLRTQDEDEARRFWTDALADVAEPTVLTLPAPARRERPDGDPAERQQRTLSRGASDRLRAFARAHRLTLNTLVQGAWALVLSQYSGAETVVFGMVISGRPAGLEDVEAIPGLFINTVPLKISVDPDAAVGTWLEDVQTRQVAASAWGHVALSRIQACTAVPRGTPLFETIFTFDNYPRLARQDAGVRASQIGAFQIGTHAHNHYPCAVSVTPGDEITLAIGFDASRFARDAITRVLAQFEHALCELAADPARQIADLPAMSRADEQQVLIDWNATARPFSNDRCLHHLIEAQVERTPDAVALMSGTMEVTYRDLNARANRVAHRLRALGVRPDAPVAVSLTRSVDLVVALLGVLKADGAYVPLDPDLPAARRAAMLADTAAPAIVTHSRWRDDFAGEAAAVVFLDGPDTGPDAVSDDNPVSHGGPDHAIYVLYTSGSTGVPKGVTNVHRGVINRLEWMRDAYGIGPGDRVLQKTPYTFDFSACELFLPLISGATMVIAGPDDHRDPAALARVIREARVTMVHFVPSMLAMFLEVPGVETLDSLRWLFSGGEALGRDVMETCHARMPCPLVNVYGPTEAAIDVTAWPCAEPTPHDQVPIGFPIDNIRMYILDRRFRPVPPGAPGELYIGGVGLARDYCHRSGQTAERFVPDPFGDAGGRLYRTGDVARHAGNGAIEFLGRADAQVKIRGFRIELGEIEAALRALPVVREAAVVVSAEPEASRLIAFVVPNDAVSSKVLTDQVRPQLAATLPEYMVPSRIVIIDAVPRTTGGKVDRKRLLAMPLPESGAEGHVPPETVLEQRLAAVWQEVLHVERVGRHDNFFELGGDSILSIQVVARLHKRGVRTTVADLFEHPTIAALATVAGVAVQHEPVALPAAGVPLTPIQQRFFEQPRANPHHYNQAVLLTVDCLDLERVERIVAGWQAAHEALRLRYQPTPTGWSAIALDRETHRVVTLVDLSMVPAADWRPMVERVGASLQAGLHLTDGPLLRMALIRGGAQHGDRLLLVVHHLAIDAVSWRLLLDDWTQTLSTQANELPPIAVPFRAWARALAEHARTPAVVADAEYWLAQTSPAAPLRVDDADGAHTVALSETMPVVLSADETRSLLQNAKRRGVSVHELLVAAVAGAVAGSMGSADIRLDVEGHGRDAVVDGIDVSRTVGWFTTIYPVVLHLPETATTGLDTAWPDLLAAVATQLRAIPNRGATYGLLRYLHDDGALRARLAATPQAQIRFNHLGQVDQDLAGNGVRLAPEAIGPWQDPAERRVYEIEVLSKIVDGVLTIEWTFSPARLSADTMETIAARGRSLLLAGAPRARLAASDFPLAALRSEELEALITRYPDLEDVYPLAPVQHGLLFHTLYAPGSGIYVPQMSVRLGGLDVGAFQSAWALAVERHTILRTAFVQDDLSRPMQVVRLRARPTWEMEDWRGCDQATLPARAQAYLDRARQAGVAFGDAPMMKLALARVSADDYYFFWTGHHALLDAWSTRLLLEEVHTSYQALREGRGPLLPPARPYRDYIEWLGGQDAAEVSRFWRELLADAPRTVLADPHRSSAAATAAHAGRQTLQLSSEVTQQPQALARQRGLTVNTLVQGAWALVLAHETGALEVTFGITVSGRPADLPDIESLIGNLIHTVPLRVATPPAMTVRAYLDGIFARNVAMRRCEHAAIAPNRTARANEALFNSILVFQNVPGSLTVDGLQGVRGSEHMTVERTHYPLSLIVIPGRTGMRVEFGYDARSFTPPWVARILSLLEIACRTLAAMQEGTVEEALRILSRHEPTRSMLKRTRRQPIVGVVREVKS